MFCNLFGIVEVVNAFEYFQFSIFVLITTATIQSIFNRWSLMHRSNKLSFLAIAFGSEKANTLIQ